MFNLTISVLEAVGTSAKRLINIQFWITKVLRVNKTGLQPVFRLVEKTLLSFKIAEKVNKPNLQTKAAIEEKQKR